MKEFCECKHKMLSNQDENLILNELLLFVTVVNIQFFFSDSLFILQLLQECLHSFYHSSCTWGQHYWRNPVPCWKATKKTKARKQEEICKELLFNSLSRWWLLPGTFPYFKECFHGHLFIHSESWLLPSFGERQIQKMNGYCSPHCCYAAFVHWSWMQP